MQPSTDLSSLSGTRYVSLTTFRKTGAPVSTPVWIAPDAQNRAILYVLTMVGAGKVKRIRNNPAIELAPCDYRGRVRGPAVPATGRILSPDEHATADRALTRKYGLQKKALDLYHYLSKGRRTYLAIEARRDHAPTLPSSLPTRLAQPIPASAPCEKALIEFRRNLRYGQVSSVLSPFQREDTKCRIITTTPSPSTTSRTSMCFGSQGIPRALCS